MRYGGAIGSPVRKVFGETTYNRLMYQILKDMQEIGGRLQTEKAENYRSTREYLATLMKQATQEDLILALPQLTYQQLKHVVAAGIPGDAFRMGQELLAAHKEKLRAYMEDNNKKATMTVESEDIEEDKKED